MAELDARIFELADRSQEVLVADTGMEAVAALPVLMRLGRDAKLTVPEPAEPGEPIYRLWRPPAFLEEIASELTPGKALCLACGTGREAVWLAAKGWHVTAIDLLPDALAQGQALEARYAPQNAPSIEWIQADLRQVDLPVKERFDLVTQFLFWSPETPTHLRQTLAEKGTGVIEVFTEAYREAKGARQEGRRWDNITWQGWTVKREEPSPDGKTRRIVIGDVPA